MTDFVTPDRGPRFAQETSTDLVTTLEQRASLAATLANPDLTLARAAATYILYKRRRLSEASERGYTATLEHFTAHHPNAKLVDFEPPNGAPRTIELTDGQRITLLQPAGEQTTSESRAA